MNLSLSRPARSAGGRPRLTGLFPGLETVGGVQASGRLAMEACASTSNVDARFVCYAPTAHAKVGIAGEQNIQHAATRTRALLAAWRASAGAAVVLVWHTGLLRLLPVPRRGPGRVVLFLHGIEAWRRYDPLTRWWLNHVDLFLSNSQHTWLEFVKHAPRLPPAAHVTIHLGIGNAPQALHAPSISPPFAVMLGRMTRTESYKGHHEVIAAWPLVVRQLPDAQLWIAGDGDLRPDLERQALECGLGQAVRFLGPVSDQEKERLLARARCLIMPSRGEGFGLVYIEAMRQGRPCLVSTVDAGREVVNPPEAGLAADLDSPDDLARASCRLLGSGAEWDTWSLRARQRYEREFTALAFQNRLRVALLPMLSFC